MAPVTDFSNEAMVVSVHNTFLHYSGIAEEEEEVSQPCLLRAVTAPVSKLREGFRSSAMLEKSNSRTSMDMLEKSTSRTSMDTQSQAECSPQFGIGRVNTFDEFEPRQAECSPCGIGRLNTFDEFEDADGTTLRQAEGGPARCRAPEQGCQPQRITISLEASTRNAVTPQSFASFAAQKATSEQATASRRTDGKAISGGSTVMLRNVPNNYTRADLVDLLDGQGFSGKYDFIYFPIDFRTHCALGYAFVNFLTGEEVADLRQRLDGFTGWSVPSGKVCSVGRSQTQGLTNNIERYRNSPLMHETVPDEYRPMIFKNGERQPFPPPTKKIKPPRQGTQRMLV